ncbi:hypothetical protein L0F63_003693, partial [Massospora cicadina]
YTEPLMAVKLLLGVTYRTGVVSSSLLRTFASQSCFYTGILFDRGLDLPCSMIREDPTLCRVMMPNGESHCITFYGLPAKTAYWGSWRPSCWGHFSGSVWRFTSMWLTTAYVPLIASTYGSLTRFNCRSALGEGLNRLHAMVSLWGAEKLSSLTGGSVTSHIFYLPVRDGSFLDSERELASKAQALLINNCALAQLLPLLDHYKIALLKPKRDRCSKLLEVQRAYPAVSVHGLPFMQCTGNNVTRDLFHRLICLMDDPLEPYLEIPTLSLFELGCYDTRDASRIHPDDAKPFLKRTGFQPKVYGLRHLKQTALFPSTGWASIFQDHKCLRGVPAPLPCAVLPAKRGVFGEGEVQVYMKLIALGYGVEDVVAHLPTRTLAQLPTPPNQKKVSKGAWYPNETATLLKTFWAAGFSVTLGYSKLRQAFKGVRVMRQFSKAVGTRTIAQCRAKMLNYVNKPAYLAQLLGHENETHTTSILGFSNRVRKTPLSSTRAKYPRLIASRGKLTIQSSKALEEYLMRNGLCQLLESSLSRHVLRLGILTWGPNRYVDSINLLSTSSPLTTDDLVIFDRLISLPITFSLLRIFFPGRTFYALKFLFWKLNQCSRPIPKPHERAAVHGSAELLNLFLKHGNDWQVISEAFDLGISPEQCCTLVTYILNSLYRRKIPRLVCENAASKFLMKSRPYILSRRRRLTGRPKNHAFGTRFKLIGSPISTTTVRCFDHPFTEALPHPKPGIYTFITPTGTFKYKVT